MTEKISGLVQADANADDSSEKVTLPSEQEAFLRRDFELYRARGNDLVGAYRAGLSSAMGICDHLAEECGSRTKAKRLAREYLKIAGDRIENFRSKCIAKVTSPNEAENPAVSLNQSLTSESIRSATIEECAKVPETYMQNWEQGEHTAPAAHAIRKLASAEIAKSIRSLTKAGKGE